MISKSELMHHRLQAWLRENRSDDVEYLGEHQGEHWYRFGEHEVTVDCVEGIELVES